MHLADRQGRPLLGAPDQKGAVRGVMSLLLEAPKVSWGVTEYLSLYTLGPSLTVGGL